MIALHARQDTVFSVLGDAARRRRLPGLVVQFAVSAIICAAILLLAPQWWSLAFLAGWSASYAAWGLVVRVAEARPWQERFKHALLVGIATVGTVLAVAGVIGVGLAFYTGHGAGIKNACGKGSTNELCQQPAVTSRPLP